MKLNLALKEEQTVLLKSLLLDQNTPKLLIKVKLIYLDKVFEIQDQLQLDELQRAVDEEVCSHDAFIVTGLHVWNNSENQWMTIDSENYGKSYNTSKRISCYF